MNTKPLEAAFESIVVSKEFDQPQFYGEESKPSRSTRAKIISASFHIETDDNFKIGSADRTKDYDNRHYAVTAMNAQ